jgi:3-dehydroquinate dehydratase-2
MAGAKHIVIINGPNLNLVGQREPGIYGVEGIDGYLENLQAENPTISFEFYQSNVEGEIINKLHEVGFTCDGIVLNAGGYTHTSVAIADAIAAIESPVVEVHISNIHSREEFRHHSLLAGNCAGVITGLGLYSYVAAVNFLNQD